MLWTPAQTYPNAIFSISVSGTIEAIDKGGFAGVLPWDDGAHSFTSAEMSQLKAETVGFQAYSYIEGPLFGFPESIYQRINLILLFPSPLILCWNRRAA